MPTRLPHLLIHQNRRIHTVHVVALVNKPAPPQIHNIPLQRYAKRTVIPCATQAAINIRALVNKTAAFTQAY